MYEVDRVVYGKGGIHDYNRQLDPQDILSCTILCRTAFYRLSNDGQRRIAQRIDVDGAPYKPHGQKLAGRAFNREWNNVGETASAAAAGNWFHSGMVRATNDPWSYAVTAPKARHLK